MTRTDNKITVILLLILFIVLLAGWLSDIITVDKLKKENKELKTQLKRDQETIESQVRMLIKLRDDCSCEWLYDFYLEHAEEVGAYE